MIKILLLIDYSSEFDRKLLRGLIKYGKENGFWLFYRLPSYYISMYGCSGISQWAKNWKANAIIGKLTDETIDLQKELNIPIVLQNYKHRSTSCSNLTGDYLNTGKMAAKYFFEKKYMNYAFFGLRGVVWSEERCEGYSKEIKRLKGNFFKYESENINDNSRDEIIEWIKNLPKPIAMFCCDDEHALYISETCKIASINIPKEIALLGVDNDELMCNISDPPISSIELGVEKGGYMMGKLIDMQIKNEYKDSFNIVINPIRIETRQSTEEYNIANPFILTILKKIDSNYHLNVSVEDIISDIPLSRRSFEIKFKEIMGITIYQYILNYRCKQLAKLLTTTNRPLKELCTEVGFNDYYNVSRIFKKYMKYTPNDYRKFYSNLD